MAPTGLPTQSERETLYLLFNTHFPESVQAEGVMLAAPPSRTNRVDWRVATKIVTYRRLEWAINSFSPYKSQGVDGIFPALLQEGRGSLFGT